MLICKAFITIGDDEMMLKIIFYALLQGTFKAITIPKGELEDMPLKFDNLLYVW